MKHIYIGIIALFVLVPTFARANPHAVSPVVLEYTLEPRQQVEATLTIMNPSDRALRIFATVNEVEQGEGGVQAFLPPAAIGTATSVTSWIEISRGRIEVPPGGTLEVPIKVAAGLDAKPGNYYAFIGLGEGSKRDEVEALALRGAVPGTMVRVAIADTKREYAALEGLSAKRFMTRAEDKTITYTINNMGDKPVSPTGEIIFYRQNGAEAGSVPLPAGQVLEPGQTKTYTVAVPEDLGSGKFRAYLEVNYSTRTMNDTIFFSIIPILHIVIAFIGTLLLSTLLTLWYHKQKRVHVEVYHDEESVPLYVRQGHQRDEKDHDIHIKK